MTSDPGYAAPPLAGRREWWGLAVLALPTLLLAIDLGVLYLALPSLSADLDPSSNQTLWIMDIYAFMMAGFLVTMGTLGDRIGRRKLMLIGAVAFGVASVLAAYADSATMLIIARALLGVAGATLAPATLALISTMFADERQRGMAIGVWMSCFMAGTALGPIVGGALLQGFWWGSVFLVGVPVMVVLLIAGPILLPEYRDESAGRLDPLSVVLSLGTILPVIYGIKEIAHYGLTSMASVAIVVGVALGIVFVRRQKTLESPLIDVELFRGAKFSGALGIMVLGPVVMGGVGLFSNQFLQLVEGLEPLHAGLWLLPSAFSTVAGVMLAPTLAAKLPPSKIVAYGALVLAVGAILLTQVSAVGGLPVLVIGVCLVFFGFGPMAALGTEMVISSAPEERAGSAASMSETSSELGVALGVAILGSIGTAVYRGQITETLPPGLPEAQAAAASDTIVGADAAAEAVGGGTGEALITAAREAFTSGLNTVGAITIGIGVVLAAVAALVLRDRGTDTPEPVEEQAEELKPVEIKPVG
jgi:DHA2 family multidrug resistance protein-like MFS transporter